MMAAERNFFNTVVDGLRRAGWSKSDAEGEAIGRVENQRVVCARCGYRVMYPCSTPEHYSNCENA